MEREYEFMKFYAEFLEKFRSYFNPFQIHCPFGPNYGAYNSTTWPNGTMCSLEGVLEFEVAAGVDVQGDPWGSLAQRAFFIPIEMIDEAWNWSMENRGRLDIVKHPNSGGMHDDQGLRRVWSGTSHLIKTLEFPCNVPATGCQDNDYEGPPNCGCDGPRVNDSRIASCKNCVVMGNLPPKTMFV